MTLVDSLLHSVAESGVGSFIGRVFVGTVVYADDIVLLPLQLAVYGPCCTCVTCLPTTFQWFLMPLKLSVYGSKLGEFLLHDIRTLLVF